MKLLGLVALLAVPASAIATDPAADKQAQKQERKVCKSDVQSQSRISKRRTCRTIAEWKAEEEMGIANTPIDHSYKAQLGNGEGLSRGPN